MLVLHAHWTDGTLAVWGESLELYRAHARGHGVAPAAAPAPPIATRHPFASAASDVHARLVQAGSVPAETSFAIKPIRVRLPRDASGPWPSERLAGLGGDADRDHSVDPWLGDFEIESLEIPNDHALAFLLGLEDHKPADSLDFSHALRYWIVIARFTVDLLADQRFIPTLIQERGNALKAAWQPWLHDDETRKRVGQLLNAMPPIARAAIDAHEHRPWPILHDALQTLTNAAVRSALAHEHFIDAIDQRDPKTDQHVAWLSGLLDRSDQVVGSLDVSSNLLRDAGLWVARLDDTGQNRPLHLCLRLNEPQSPSPSAATTNKTSSAASNPPWLLSLHLQSSDDPNTVIDAAAIWNPASQNGEFAGVRVDHPQELLLSELARASRLYPKLESVLSEQTPTALALNAAEAHEFLRDVRPVLEESGIAVLVPAWWNQPLGRLAARLQIEAPSAAAAPPNGSGTSPSTSMLGLNSLVRFRWQVAVGDQPLTEEEFAALFRETSPLVKIRDKWVEVNPQQLAEARQFLEKTPGGEMTLLEAVHMAHGLDGKTSAHSGLPILGMDVTGWVADVLGASSDEQRLVKLEQPLDFLGTLRPYQKIGLSWLAFLDRFGLGACLADDMGLGKTIQLIALLLHERAEIRDQRSEVSESESNAGGAQSSIVNQQSSITIGPTLLIVPTSVIGNWVRELQRFAPSLTAHVHHGADRAVGDRFAQVALSKDVVITTYPLVARDHDTLRRVAWHRVALDEAQYIKNPPTKQTTAIRSLSTPRRLALTGTPVENRLSELWSIMEFCNPGYLGAAGEFRRRFAVPIERHRDQRQADRLRHMVRPFILRRVKTDPTVIDDLPLCLETKEYATLTPEQAALYQRVVNHMLADVDHAEGMQRRGLVLATLVKLKQICNHPETGAKSQVSGDGESEIRSNDQPSLTSDTQPLAPALLSARSGKAKRLIAMLEEVLATGERALIFTQFRQMGHLLTAMIQNDLDREAIFMHGGTPTAKRQHMIDRFQSPEGSAPIFVLSLKAGGLGLNLTAANHVFHFDRWWNPAVENQATDRAYRIGQTRNVHVHKFVCVGTLEERIDQMIEQKTELAQNIIGAGEQWLTELSTSQLHDLLTLRPSATEPDA